MNSNMKLDMNSVIVTLVNAEKYKDKLKEMSYDEFLDLYVVYRQICKDADGKMTFSEITNAMIEESEISIDVLRKYGYANLVRLYGSSYKYIKGGKYILTNERKLFGTALILHSFILEGLSQRLQGDIYIVPISTHECMAVSKRKSDPEKLLSDLKERNREAANKDEILSDNIYFYDSVTKELSVYTK